MGTFQEDRRALLLSLGGFDVTRLAQPTGRSDSVSPFVLAPSEGEHLVHFRDGGDIYIKAGPATDGATSPLARNR